MDQKIFAGLYTNYLKLSKVERDVKEAKRILDYMVMDDYCQSFQYRQASFGQPKYCFSSIFYAMYFFKESKRIKFDFYDRITGMLILFFCVLGSWQIIIILPILFIKDYRYIMRF